MYNSIVSFFQGYYPLTNKDSLEPDFLAVSEAQLESEKNNDTKTSKNEKNEVRITIEQENNVQEDEKTSGTINTNSKKSFFLHLQFRRQSYFSHFRQAIKYSMLTCKASFCFFIHAIYPDVFQHTGSDIIVGINDEILQAYKDCMDIIDKEIFDL